MYVFNILTLFYEYMAFSDEESFVEILVTVFIVNLMIVLLDVFVCKCKSLFANMSYVYFDSARIS